MNKKWSKWVLSFMVIVIALALSVLLLWNAPGVAADDVYESWDSSADPPEGITIEALSPPDQPGLNNNLMEEGPEVQSNTRSHRITGSALRPRDSVVEFDVSSSGGCIYAETSAFDVFNTPIWLHQGATVEQLRMYYDDTSASNSSAWFTVYDLYGEIVEEWGVNSSGDFGLGFNDTAEFSHVIDYSSYSYLLNWRPVVTGTSMQLCGFRIFYEVPPFHVQFMPYVVN